VSGAFGQALERRCAPVAILIAAEVEHVDRARPLAVLAVVDVQRVELGARQARIDCGQRFDDLDGNIVGVSGEQRDQRRFCAGRSRADG